MEEQDNIKAIIESESASIPYKPVSKGQSLDVHVPRNMAFELQAALNKIEKQSGSLDLYVKEKLRYGSLSELYGALSAEQIDAVALAISNIERGEAIIVGDMTGIGKGRIAAAVIRYAVKHGYNPIFLTEKSNLFSDIYRDLKGIGSAEMVPLLINNDEEADIKDVDPKTDKLETIYQHLSGSALKSRVEGKNEVPDGYHFVCATYSQFNQDYYTQIRRALLGLGQRPKGPTKSQYKSDFLRSISRDNILIFDEAHNAGGLSSTIGAYLREILEYSRGAVYLSATFAKRPDNLPLYAVKTVMKEAYLSMESLVRSILDGGTALQEIIAANLVEAGQMVRRERTFEGIKIEYNELALLKPEHACIFDRVTTIIREIIDFQKKHVTPIIKTWDNEVKEQEGATAQGTRGTSMAGVDNPPFVSKVFNIIDQLLFSIKAEAVAEEAIAALKADKKPIIAFKSTMGSFLADMGLKEGDYIDNTDFTLTFRKALDTVMRYTIVDVMGNSNTKKIEPYELGASGLKEYEELEEKIETTGTGISISPIDLIIYKIENAGYKVGEVTGRSQRIRFSDGERSGTIENYKTKKNEIFNRFNNGGHNKIDVVLLNQSGATGASLHASATFKDQRTRVMIIHQIELNVNIEVQKRGRINRTGQVRKPEYKYVTTSIPAEKRLMMMMKSKMKSLDANTTGNQKSSDESLKSEDFLNKYGDEIVYKYLEENEEFNKLLLDPLHIRDTEKETVTEGAANKVTGRVAILATSDQEKFYKEIIDRYNNYVAMLKANDNYDLETSFENLEAEPIKKQIIVAGRGGRSAFGQDSINELCKVNVLRKPFTKSEVEEHLEAAMSGSNPQVRSTELIKKYGDFFPGWKEMKMGVLRRDIDEVQKKVLEEREGAKNESRILKLEEDIKLLHQELSKRENKYEAQRKSTIQLFEFFKIGKVVHVVFQEGFDDYSLGIVLGTDIDFTKDNPYAPSSILLQIACADSRRKLTIPASSYSFIDSIVAKSYNIPASEIENALKFWDKANGNKSKEHRWIVTGNILQGLGHIKGKLIKFTTSAGEIKNGIKLSETFGREENDYESTVPIEKAIDLIEELNIGESLLTAGEEIKFTNANLNFYEIRIPKSLSRGGKFYMDQELRKLIARPHGKRDELGTFISIGQEMSGMLHKQNLKDFVKILNDKFRLSVKTSAIEVTDTEDTRGEGKEFEFKLTRPFGLGAYPPIGFLRHDNNEGQYGTVFYDRDLEIKVRLNFSIVPVYDEAEEPVSKWYKDLSPVQEEMLQTLKAEIKSKNQSGRLAALSNFMLSTNVIGNPEFTFGEFSERELAGSLAERLGLEVTEKSFLEISRLIKQLRLVA